jgi:hypothetical protein
VRISIIPFFPFLSIFDWHNYNDLELDVPDRFGRTPLHFAAQHGALISTLFLLQKGVMLDREDSGGR